MTRKKSKLNQTTFVTIPTPADTTKLGDLYRKRQEHIQKKRYNNRVIYNCTQEINKILSKFAGMKYEKL